MSTVKELTRMSGLISGLDIESLVKAGTMNTKTALDSRKQKLQSLQWKQEAYRGVITTLSDFQKEYLNIESSASIRANAVMKAKKTTCSDDKMIVTASASAVDGNYSITSVQKAQTAKFEGGRASTGTVSLDFAGASRGTNYVKVTLDGTTKTVAFSGGADTSEAKENFLTALNESFSSVSSARFAFDGKKLKVANNDGVSHIFTIGYDRSVGLVNDASNMISTQSALGSLDFNNPLQGSEFKFSINGKEFTFNKDTKIKDMMNTINNAKIGVKMSFNTLSQSFELESEQTGAGQELKISQSKGNLINALFNKSDSELSTGPTLSKALTEKSVDNTGLEFKFSLSETGLVSGDNLYLNGTALGLSGISQKQNTSKINVKGLTDVEASVFTDTTDNKDVYKYKVDGVTYYSKSNGSGGYDDLFSVSASGIVNVGGVDQEGVSESDMLDTMHLNKQLKVYTADEIRDSFNNAYQAAYPSGTGSFDIDVTNGTATLTFTPGSGEAVDFVGRNGIKVNGEVGGSVKNFTETGVANTTVVAGSSVSFSVNGASPVTVTGTGEGGKVTIKDLVDTGHFVYDSASGKIGVVGSEKLTFIDGANDMFVLFGTSELSGVDSVGDMTARGSNSRITINGVTLESATNDFTVEGTTFNIKDVKNFTAQDIEDGKAEEITVDVTRDTSGIKETVMKFVEEYNNLIDSLYKTIDTSRPKSSGEYYDPLTEDQEDEMDEKEIEKWNEKAKEGLLYHDSAVTKVFNNIRNAVASASVGGMTLKDLGIDGDSKAAVSEHGKLHIKESELEAAIAKYGDEVAAFFTDTKTGLGTKLNEAINSAIDTKTNNRGYPLGSLTALAGIEKTRSEKKNMIYSQISSIESIIEKLKERYESEQERLWKRFSSLETYIANMNNQSMSLFGTALAGSQQQQQQ